MTQLTCRRRTQSVRSSSPTGARRRERPIPWHVSNPKRSIFFSHEGHTWRPTGTSTSRTQSVRFFFSHAPRRREPSSTHQGLEPKAFESSSPTRRALPADRPGPDVSNPKRSNLLLPRPEWLPTLPTPHKSRTQSVRIFFSHTEKGRKQWRESTSLEPKAFDSSSPTSAGPSGLRTPALRLEPKAFESSSPTGPRKS